MENELEQANMEEVETEEVETEAEEVVEEETTEQPEKVRTFTQDEVDEMIKSRIKRERNKIERDYTEEINKYKELAYLTQEGLKADNLEDTLEKSRQFYGKQGITYKPAINTREDEILAKAYAEEIIEECESTEDLKKAADKYIAKGKSLTNREKLVLENIVSEMESRQRVTNLKTIGVKEEIYNSKEFREFESKFTKDTPIEDIYNLYRLSKKTTEKVASNPGSMKTTQVKEKKEYITEAEYDKMTDKEIEENMDLIMSSMKKW